MVFTSPAPSASPGEEEENDIPIVEETAEVNSTSETPPSKKRALSFSPAVNKSIPDPFPFPAKYPHRLQQALESGEVYGTDRLAFIRHICDVW